MRLKRTWLNQSCLLNSSKTPTPAPASPIDHAHTGHKSDRVCHNPLTPLGQCSRMLQLSLLLHHFCNVGRCRSGATTVTVTTHLSCEMPATGVDAHTVSDARRQLQQQQQLSTRCVQRERTNYHSVDTQPWISLQASNHSVGRFKPVPLPA